jgi:hypothetical protein
MQLLKNFPKFYGTRRFIAVLTRALRWSLSWTKSIQSITPYPIHFIIIPHLRLSLPCGLFPSGFPTKILYAFSFHHACYMPYPSYPPWLHHSNYTWRRAQVMKLLVMQFFPTSRHFISLQCKHSPQTLFANILSLCSSLNVRDQVSHPYRTTNNIIVLYIIIFTFLDKRREDKRFCAQW